MRIPVQYFDGTFDYVTPGRLDALIKNRKITGFRRNEGWVRVPHGPLRANTSNQYSGPERRSKDD